MALETELIVRNGSISDLERQRIERRVASLAKRLQNFPEPRATMAIETRPHRADIDLRVSLGPLGGHLVSHETSESLDVAVKQAVDDVKRQLEKRLATQRGEPTYGVPSRRLPEELRPNPMGESEEVLYAEEIEEEMSS